MILHHQGFSAPGLASIESSGPASSSSSAAAAAQSIDHPPCHLIIITHLRHLRHNCLSCPPFSSNHHVYVFRYMFIIYFYRHSSIANGEETRKNVPMIWCNRTGRCVLAGCFSTEGARRKGSNLELSSEVGNLAFMCIYYIYNII